MAATRRYSDCAVRSESTKAGAGLSGGAIGGIVVGCVAGVVLVASVSYIIYKKSQNTALRGSSLSSRVNPTFEA